MILRQIILFHQDFVLNDIVRTFFEQNFIFYLASSVEVPRQYRIYYQYFDEQQLSSLQLYNKNKNQNVTTMNIFNVGNNTYMMMWSHDIFIYGQYFKLNKDQLETQGQPTENMFPLNLNAIFYITQINVGDYGDNALGTCYLFYGQTQNQLPDQFFCVRGVNKTNNLITTIALINPYGYYYKSKQFSYYNECIMLSYYNNSQKDQGYNIFLAIYNISTLLDQDNLFNILYAYVNRPNIPIQGGFNLVNTNPTIQFTLTSLNFKEKNVIMNAFIGYTDLDSHLIRLKVMDEIQFIIWVDENKINKYTNDEIANISTVTNITINAINALNIQSMDLKINNSWISYVYSSETQKQTKPFHYWYYILIAIGALIIFILLVIVYRYIKNNKKNKEDKIEFDQLNQYELTYDDK